MNRIGPIERRGIRQSALRRVAFLSYTGAFLFDLVSFGASADVFRPDLTLLVVLYWSTRSRSPMNVLTPWFIGLLRDIATLTPLGLHAGLYCLTAWAGAGLQKRFETIPLTGELVLVSLVLLAGSMLSWGMGILLNGTPSPGTHLIAPLIGTLSWPALRILLKMLSTRRRRSARFD